MPRWLRVNTVRCGLFDESVFSTIQKAVSAMIHTSINQFHTIPFCGQMFMNTPTQTVLPKQKDWRVNSLMSKYWEESAQTTIHSLVLSNTHTLQPSKLRLKASCKKNCHVQFPCQIHSEEALSIKITGKLLLPISEVLWWAALMGSTDTMQEMRHQPWNLSGRCNQPLKYAEGLCFWLYFLTILCGLHN